MVCVYLGILPQSYENILIIPRSDADDVGFRNEADIAAVTGVEDIVSCGRDVQRPVVLDGPDGSVMQGRQQGVASDSETVEQEYWDSHSQGGSCQCREKDEPDNLCGRYFHKFSLAK